MMRVQIDNICYAVEFVEYRGDKLFLVPVGCKDMELHIIGEEEKIKALFKHLVMYGYMTDSMLAGMEVEEIDV